jgi:DNA topoisomerase-2
MAQDFVGSNNINLLEPQGQFGTRLSGGDDAASPRYIFTQLSPVSRLLFPEVDDAILDYREDDGQMIEPEFYCPIIPLLLVNGSQGIGTGWSTFIAPHNPLDLIDYVRSKLDGVQQHQLPVLRPFARGFDGAIEENPDGDGYVSIGRASKTSKSTIVIDELPLRIWTDAYKTTLIKMRDRGEIQHFVENHTTSKVRFEIHSKTAQLNRMVNSGLENVFKLRKSLPMTNMNAFDSHNRIRKFDSAESIIEEYFPVRLGLYYDRQSLLESETKYGSAVSQNKARFIEAVSNGRIKLTTGRKTKEETVMELKSLGYSTVDELQRIRNDNTVFKRRLVSQEPLDDNEEDATLTIEHESPTRSDFDYLLNMPLSSLTSERIQELLKDAAKKDDELKLIQSKSAEDLWRSDLDKLAQHL